MGRMLENYNTVKNNSKEKSEKKNNHKTQNLSDSPKCWASTSYNARSPPYTSLHKPTGPA